MNTFIEAMVTIVLAIVGLGVVSVLVSKKAQTPQVIQAAGSALGNTMGVAESPVTGETYKIDLSYPGQDFSTSFGYG